MTVKKQELQVVKVNKNNNNENRTTAYRNQSGNDYENHNNAKGLPGLKWNLARLTYWIATWRSGWTMMWTQGYIGN